MTTSESNIHNCNGHARNTPVEHTRGERYFRPNVDILERPDELLVLADMPRVAAGGVDINFDKGILTILGHTSQRQASGAQHVRREYGVGDYYRTFQVSDDVDPQRITAEMSNGVLTLRIPKSEVAKPRKIAVEAK